MDHMIKEKFIVTDGEKVTDEIYRVTGLDIEMMILKNMPRLIFCSGKPERSTLLL